MLGYLDFYHIAEYGNKMWKGCFSAEEIAENAHIYKCDYDYSLEHQAPTCTMISLCELICEDMDFHDYDDCPSILDITTMQNILKNFVLEVL